MTNLRLIATAAVSLAVGGVIGYKYAEKKLVAEFEQRLDRETDQLRRMYKPEYNTPQDMVAELHGEAGEAMLEYQGEPKEPVAYHKIRVSGVPIGDKEQKPLIERSVFEPDDERGEIYVISAQEHADGEAGYEQATWTYYAKDGVVTDPSEDRIEDYVNFLGPHFADNFGKDSGDENVVYIRNEVVMMDYEILRSHGSYVEEVLQEEYTPPVERPSQRIRGS